MPVSIDYLSLCVHMCHVWGEGRVYVESEDDFTRPHLTPTLFFFFFFWFFFSELGTEPQALRFLGKRSATEISPQPQTMNF